MPTDEAGNFIPEEAEQLGKKANSHGCIRLSVADAQWFYTAIPYNTKVVIH
ncbi:ykud domain protein [Latilactobacillus curvatus]|nr:ykud domain protein [Latilactobacillus curvatus]